MLIPKTTKYRKLQKMPVSLLPTTRGNTLAFGQYGLQALEPGRITAQQIEACRKLIRRKTKRFGNL